MRKYNMYVDDNINSFLKEDLYKCMTNKMGFGPVNDAYITYTISQEDSIRLYKSTPYSDCEIDITTLLWDSFIPFITKEAYTCLISSSKKFNKHTESLSNKIGFQYYSVDKFPLHYDNYCIIGDHNLNKIISHNLKNLKLYTIDLTMETGFHRFNTIYTMNINSKIGYMNIWLMDLTSILVDVMYNDFYRIGEK